jgi:hypothetical protein
MSDTTSKRPTFTAYSVRDYQKNGQKESDWARVGVAWPHKDGKGVDVILEAIPVSGRVAIRENKPKPQAQA